MNEFSFNAKSLRLAKAKLSAHLGSIGDIMLGGGVFVLLAGVLILFTGHLAGLSLTGVGISAFMIAFWLQDDVNRLPPAPIGTTLALDQLLPANLAARYHPDLTSGSLWQLLSQSDDVKFILIRFDLKAGDIATILGEQPIDHQVLINEAIKRAGTCDQTTLSAALLMSTLCTLEPKLHELLTMSKLEPTDLDEGIRWVDRLEALRAKTRPFYGGLARDWASGFTPLLAQFGTNLSQQVEMSGTLGPEERLSQLDTLITGLESGTGSVVLIGEPGIGKTALLIGLADHLLEGGQGPLAHHQIVALSASMILSNVSGPGDIERTVLSLFDEATRAGNIVLALDEAELFFGQGAGAVNLSQVLLPILQAHAIKLVLAVTPGDWQRLRATNTAMTSLLTPLVLAEPNEVDVLRLLADHALMLEHGRFITTWHALQEAYRLSGRYFEDEAYPGRAMKLLEAAGNYPDSEFLSERSVQQAIESQFGVKVQQASGPESDELLHLEDHIHERMINQTRAVSVVSAALRRARAGVANPKRPIGSFLFLGPTGVGKTELAKSLAATYFHDETNLIRLDMSEYQQVADVDRILESAAENAAGLLPHVRQNPFSVVLFDEIEKAHPNVLNLFLQLLDEGELTDTSGHTTSFKDTIIIATSNAGADQIRDRIEAGQKLEDFEQEFVNQLIDAGAFKPELLNRFDEIVLFRPLNEAELAQVVRLMIGEVNRTLAAQHITVALTDAAVAELVTIGYDPRLGARPMRRMVQRRVEDVAADMILRGAAHAGDTITLDAMPQQKTAA